MNRKEYYEAYEASLSRQNGKSWPEILQDHPEFTWIQRRGYWSWPRAIVDNAFGLVFLVLAGLFATGRDSGGPEMLWLLAPPGVVLLCCLIAKAAGIKPKYEWPLTDFGLRKHYVPQGWYLLLVFYSFSIIWMAFGGG